MIKVKLVGATGYGGIGLIELLLRHPQMELSGLVAREGAGEKLSKIWPYLDGFCDHIIQEAGSQKADDIPADVVVFATPDGVGQDNAVAEVSRGRKVLDYSGDFRFNTVDLYREYARRQGLEQKHRAPELLAESVYGLPELHRKKIAAAQVVGNPGCFAVSCTMGLAPAVARGCVELTGLYCDCKTGVSGAGKKPKPGFHYPEQYDNTYAYKLAGHQHVMEIERELSLLTDGEVKVTFTPQVVPMTRGIISTLYGKLASGMTQEKVLESYRDFYAREKFVRIVDDSVIAGTGQVRGSNFVNLQVACDERTGTFRVISHIDNLVKGQAGSALQNLNVLFGLEETLGLDQPGAHP